MHLRDHAYAYWEAYHLEAFEDTFRMAQHQVGQASAEVHQHIVAGKVLELASGTLPME